MLKIPRINGQMTRKYTCICIHHNTVRIDSFVDEKSDFLNNTRVVAPNYIQFLINNPQWRAFASNRSMLELILAMGTLLLEFVILPIAYVTARSSLNQSPP